MDSSVDLSKAGDYLEVLSGFKNCKTIPFSLHCHHLFSRNGHHHLTWCHHLYVGLNAKDVVSLCSATGCAQGTRLRSVKYKQKCLGETFRKLLRNGADSWTSSFLPAPNSCFQPEIWIRWLTPGIIVNYEALLRMKALAKDDNPRR